MQIDRINTKNIVGFQPLDKRKIQEAGYPENTAWFDQALCIMETGANEEELIAISDLELKEAEFIVNPAELAQWAWNHFEPEFKKMVKTPTGHLIAHKMRKGVQVTTFQNLSWENESVGKEVCQVSYGLEDLNQGIAFIPYPQIKQQLRQMV